VSEFTTWCGLQILEACSLVALLPLKLVLCSSGVCVSVVTS